MAKAQKKKPRAEKKGGDAIRGSGEAGADVRTAATPAKPPALFEDLHPLDRARVRLYHVVTMLGGYSAAWGPFLAGLSVYWTKQHPIAQPESRPLLDKEKNKIVEFGENLRPQIETAIAELDGGSEYIADALPQPRRFITKLREILDEADAAVGAGLYRLNLWPPEYSTSYVVDVQLNEWKPYQDVVFKDILPRMEKFARKLRAIETPGVETKHHDIRREKLKGDSPSDLEDPVPCVWVCNQVGRKAGRSDKLANKMRRRGYPIVKLAGKNHCQREDARRMFPNHRQRLTAEEKT